MVQTKNLKKIHNTGSDIAVAGSVEIAEMEGIS
jgi:hypothetical protein